MSVAQPQLLNLSLNLRDVVYTPDAVARDVVAFFKPSGRILEPSAGDGAFLKYLPDGTAWCEIEKGRDFFAEQRCFDWLIGNPPYSVFDEWMDHSFEIAENVCYLLFVRTVYNSMPRMERIAAYGGIRSIYVIGTASSIGWESGLPVGAVHMQRNYKGGTYTHFRGQP